MVPSRAVVEDRWSVGGDSAVLRCLDGATIPGLRLLLAADLALPGEEVPAALLLCVSTCTGMLGETLLDLQVLEARPRSKLPVQHSRKATQV